MKDGGGDGTSANKHFHNEAGGDGTSAVQVYAKESSKLMLEVIKRGPKVVEEEDSEKKKDGDNLFDLSGMSRAFIEEDKARELLSPLMNPDNGFTKILFSNRSFGAKAAKFAVSVKDQITEVDLSDFVAGRTELEALEVMNKFIIAIVSAFVSF